MGEYRLLTYRRDGMPAAGVLIEGRIYPACEMLSESGLDASSVLALLERWAEAHEVLVRAAEQAAPEAGLRLEDAELLPPILYPRGLFCAGANYWDHVEEMERLQGNVVDRSKRAKDPWFFLKTSAHSVVGPGSTVAIPHTTKALDWEAELGVVIGKPARDLPPERAAEVIAGFTIVNDLSARDLMTRKDRPPAMTFDWIGQKCFDGAAPMGPWITPAAFIGDWSNLSIKLWVNGVLKQDSNTNQLIHTIEEQISWLSRHLTLQPGDVVATGTPSGVGLPRQDFLKSGDVVRIEVEKCGDLTTRLV